MQVVIGKEYGDKYREWLVAGITDLTLWSILFGTRHLVGLPIWRHLGVTTLGLGWPPTPAAFVSSRERLGSAV